MNFGTSGGSVSHGFNFAAPITSFTGVDWGGGGIETGDVSTANIFQSGNMMAGGGSLNQNAGLTLVPVLMNLQG